MAAASAPGCCPSCGGPTSVRTTTVADRKADDRDDRRFALREVEVEVYCRRRCDSRPRRGDDDRDRRTFPQNVGSYLPVVGRASTRTPERLACNPREGFVLTEA